MPVQTVKLRSPVQQLERRDFALATPALLLPSNANPVDMGEFFMLDSNYKLVRGDGSAPAFMAWVERGRSDTQAIGKMTVLFLGSYEAETLIYTATGISVGSPLKVHESVTYGSLTKSGLVVHPLGGDTDLVLGYCTKVTSGGYLRFIQTQA